MKNILVIVDPTADVHPCIEKAARLATAVGSALELFICDADQVIPEEPASEDATLGYRRERRLQLLTMLEELAAPLRDRGLRVTTESMWHVPLEEGIVTHALRSGADLVVKDTHRHLLTARMPTVQTDWILIRQLPMPLLLVRPDRWAAHPDVVVSIDPCHTAERPVELDESLLACGSALGRALEGRVELLHALEVPAHFPGEMPTEQVTRDFQAQRRGAVERLVAQQGIALAAIHTVERRIPDAIVEFVGQQKPSILVMGAVRRSRFQNSTASTASQVLEQVACDVLVVKPLGFVSPALVTER